MSENSWRTFAIVLLILFILQSLSIITSILNDFEQDQNEKSCSYDTCDGYDESEFDNEICYCYEYDLMGKLKVVKETWIK